MTKEELDALLAATSGGRLDLPPGPPLPPPSGGFGLAQPTQRLAPRFAESLEGRFAPPPPGESQAVARAKEDLASGNQIGVVDSEGNVFSPGSSGSTSASDEANASGLATNDAAMAIRDLQPGARAQQMFRKEGINYLPYGPDGKDSFDRAYVSGPQKLAQTYEDAARAHGERSDALAKHYETAISDQQRNMAAIQARRQDDAAEIAARQERLTFETQRYTNDLADQNKFWANPGNIVSAIAFSLMPIFSSDAAVGAKLINQAIDRDMANRRGLADMHLGELRSNIGMYRKIAEDRQAGDLLAQSEAHRMAAMETERIMAKFESPIAKARAQSVIQDQLIRSEQARQQATKHDLYNRPTPTTPGEQAAYAKGIPGAWEAFGKDMGAKNMGAVQSEVAGTPSTAAGAGPSRGGPQTPLTLQDRAMLASPQVMAKLSHVEARMPGGMSMIEAFKASTAQIAAAKTGYRLGMDPKAFNTEKDKIVTEAMQEPGKLGIGKALQSNSSSRSAIRQLSSDIDLMEHSAKSPAELLSPGHKFGPDGWETYYQKVKRSFRDSPSNPAAAREMAKADAIARFRQLAATSVVDYYNKMAGAALSEQELKNLKEVIALGSDWSQIKGFTAIRSKALGEEESGLMKDMTPLGQFLWNVSKGRGQSKPLGYEGMNQNPVRIQNAPQMKPAEAMDLVADPRRTHSGQGAQSSGGR